MCGEALLSFDIQIIIICTEIQRETDYSTDYSIYEDAWSDVRQGYSVCSKNIKSFYV